MSNATIIDHDSPPPLRSQLDTSRTTSNTRWGAIAAGVVMSVSLWIVLHLFGMGVGLTSIDPGGDNSLKALGIGTGIVSLIAPVVAMFLGGLTVARLAPTPNRVNRMLHGALVWAVATLAAMTMLALVISSLVRGAASVGSDAAGAVAGAVKGVAGAADGDTLQSLGIDSDELLAPINQRLRADGKPAVTAPQLEATIKDSLRSAVRDGKLDRPLLVQSLARNTALTPRDADDVAMSIETRWERVKQRGSELANQAQTAALQTAETTGKAFIGLSLALLLGVAAAVGGAALTGHHDRRQPRADEARVVRG